MAMNGAVLGTAIKNAIKLNGYLIIDAEGGDEADVEALWQIICAEVVNHIVANGVVTIPAGVAVATPDTINGTTTAPGIGTIA